MFGIAIRRGGSEDPPREKNKTTSRFSERATRTLERQIGRAQEVVPLKGTASSRAVLRKKSQAPVSTPATGKLREKKKKDGPPLPSALADADGGRKSTSGSNKNPFSWEKQGRFGGKGIPHAIGGACAW